jgi:hypothetical protein
VVKWLQKPVIAQNIKSRIDTPGFGDSRGVKLDDEHVKKI